MAELPKKSGPKAAFENHPTLQRVVHIELDRVRGHAEAGDLFHLQLDVGADEVVAEHSALGQEGAILVQIVQCLIEAGAHGRDLGFFFRRQVVEVLARGFARVDLVFHAVQAGHHHGGEGQIRVGSRIGETHFDAAGLVALHERHADRSRTVARRVSQHHRGLEAGHQTLVGIGARVSDGVERAGVLDDAADVIQRKVAQTGVAIASKQVLAVFPDGLVHMHARAVVADDGLGHEGRGLAVGVGDVLDHILHDLRPVGTLHQSGEFGADFALAGVGHFVVMHFDRHAHLFEQQAHFRADVLQTVNRGHREIAALHRRAVAHIAAFHLVAGGPGGFVGVDLDEAARHVHIPADLVENEKLGFRTEIGGIADARCFQISLGLFGDGARIAVVGFAITGFEHIAAQQQRGFFVERVDIGGVRVGHEQHVRGFDALPASDGRAVEGVTIGELAFIEMRDRHRDVLLFAAGVGETEIHEFDIVLFHQAHHVGDCFAHKNLLSG